MLTKVNDFIFTTVYAVNHRPGVEAGITGGDFLGKFTFAKLSPNTTAANTFSSLVGTILYWVLAIVALIAFIYLIMSGIKYITSGGDAAKATEARNGIINAIIGIIVIVLAYVILNFAFKVGIGVNNP